MDSTGTGTRMLTFLLDLISCFFTRRVLARLLSTFLCCLTLVVKPWSQFGGSSAFLLLTLKELVFSAQDTLAQHLEATIFNITGALFGIGLSTFAKYVASLRPDYTVSSRAIPAVFLVVIAFLGKQNSSVPRLLTNSTLAGWAKSRLPRLQLSARISCFVSIWLLTTNVGVSNGSVHTATFFVWITLSAAFICLISNILLLRWFSTHFARKIVISLSKLRECLIISLNETSSTSREGGSGSLDVVSRRRKLLDELLAESIQLDFAYSIAAFELRLGRVDVASIKPLIGVVENVRRELSWGCSHVGTSPGRGSTYPTMQPALDLGQAILASMKHVEDTLLFVFERTANAFRPSKKEAAQILHQLDQARDAARKGLTDLFGGSPKNDTTSEVSGHSHFFVSLIEMAEEMHNALIVVDRVLLLHSTSRTRLWYPRLSLAWLGIAPPTIIDDTHVTLDDDDPGRFEDEHNMSMAEAREGLSELARWREATWYSRPSSPEPNEIYYRNVIYGPRITRFRLIFATCVRGVARSSHLQHAIKNSIGVALLSLPAFLPTGSSGQKWFARTHGQWMIVSYVWVLETNTGATCRVAYLRITGTILGAVYAYITWLICHVNPYGLVVMVTLADLPISWIITRTEVPSLGVVAAVTLPPIVFSGYLDANADTGIFLLAVWRAVMITCWGLSSPSNEHLCLPKTLQDAVPAKYEPHARLVKPAVFDTQQARLSSCWGLFKRNRVYTLDNRRRTLKLELEIRDSLIRLSRLIVALRDEMSLLPKPMMQYRNTISSMQAMLDLMTGLREIREHIPVQEAVSKVMKDRREFVSCVCVSLYACENAFRSRQPLPQFLPSTRHARAMLVSHIAKSMRHSKRVLGLSHLYGFAEGEVLEDLVDTVERLLSISRTLFGTAEWLTGEPPPEVGAHC
ncbi:hypothetical protein EDB89DRAFT_2067893 [Lactarius sanguifluus]|nr:hypothetical protein EDB89DRAFT_2067893 [Lactarius sanguifluus]